MSKSVYTSLNKKEPIDSLAPVSKWKSFICKAYPKSCDKCAWKINKTCKICKLKQFKSKLTGKRPDTCQLIKVDWLYAAKQRYACLNESMWLDRNPILNEGSIVISKDLMRIKVGDGKTRYVSLPFIDYDSIRGKINDKS